MKLEYILLYDESDHGGHCHASIRSLWTLSCLNDSVNSQRVFQDYSVIAISQFQILLGI